MTLPDRSEDARPAARSWSPAGAYARTLALLLAIFAWAPVWIALDGQRSLMGFLGQLQFSGLLVFATAPLGAIPIAWHLRRGSDGALALPAVFVLLKMALVLLAAGVFYLVNSAGQPGTFSSRTAVGPRTIAFVMVGLLLSIPFGVVYGVIFRALIGLWARRAVRPAGAADR